jgi:hypothetical protein
VAAWLETLSSGHKKIPVCPYNLLPVKHVTCVEIGLSGMLGVEVGAKRVCRKGAVDSQRWTGVEGNIRILAQRATAPTKGFFILLSLPHMCW